MTVHPSAARVRLRATALGDIDFALALERHPDNAPFVGQWARDEHEASLARADREHWIIERVPGAEPVGFLIAYDLVALGFGAYVKRIVVAEKSRGLGREALAQFLRHAKHSLAAPCVWLNVAVDNPRAQRAYASLGFRIASLSESERRAHAEAAGGFSEMRIVMRYGPN